MLHSDTSEVQDDPGHIFKQWAEVYFEAMDRIGKTARIGMDGRRCRHMEAAGFEDIVEKEYRLPCGSWSSDLRLKQIGMYNLACMEQSLEGFALYLLEEVMEWEYAEIQVFVARMRKAIRDPKIRPYYIV